MDDNKTIDMEIKADTTELDEAIDKAETLQEALAICGRHAAYHH